MVNMVKRVIINMVKNTRTKTLVYACITMVKCTKFRVPKQH